MKFKIFIISFFIIGTISSYFMLSIPVFNIEKLTKGYVQNDIQKDRVVYKVVLKRPKNWTSLDSLPKHVYYAFIVSEDWSFFDHQGVDFRQIFFAIRDHLKGEKLRGASTISQQLVKNLYTKSERSLYRKVFELFTTMYLEKRLDKNKILEVYLNIIEYGDRLYGINDASWLYFKKRPSDLNPKEAAFLAMLLPNPKLYSQSFRDKKLTEFAQGRVNNILKKLKVVKVITEKDLDYYKDTHFSFERIKTKTIKNGKQILEDEFFEL